MRRSLAVVLALAVVLGAGTAGAEEPLFYIRIEAVSDSTAVDSIPVYALEPSQLKFIEPAQDSTIYRAVAGDTIHVRVSVQDTTRGGKVDITLQNAPVGARYDTTLKELIWVTPAGRRDSVVVTIRAEGEFGATSATRRVILVARLPYNKPVISASPDSVALAPGESAVVVVTIDSGNAPIDSVDVAITWPSRDEFQVSQEKLAPNQWRVTITRRSTEGQTLELEFRQAPIGLMGFFEPAQGRAR